MSQDDVLAKIRRLLKLGTSTNEHEAVLALAKAAELARKHSIDLDCVKAEDEKARIAEQVFECRGIFNEVDHAAVQLCLALFHVRCLTGRWVTGKGFAQYIGLDHNVTAAMYAHAFVIEQCGRDLKAFKKRRYALYLQRVTKGTAKDYCLGWVRALVAKYEAEIARVEKQQQLDCSRTALILSSQDKVVDDYMEKNHADVPEKKSRKRQRDWRAFDSGMVDGQKVSLNRPLDAPTPRPALGGTK